MPKPHQRESQDNHILNGESIFHPSSLYDTLSQGPLRAWGVLGSARRLSWLRSSASLALHKSYIMVLSGSRDTHFPLTFCDCVGFLSLDRMSSLCAKNCMLESQLSSNSFELSPIHIFPRLLTERKSLVSL